MNGSLKISESLTKQIAYICYKYPSIEWMGYFWYRNIDNSPFDLEMVDIVPMTTGTAAAVNIDMEKDADNYFDKLESNEELEDCFTGLVHSHHRMGTGFSSTDMDELRDNCTKFQDKYLSLVVNNYREATCKMAVQVEVNSVSNLLGHNVKTSKKEIVIIPIHVTMGDAPTSYPELDKCFENIQKVNKEKELLARTSHNYNNQYYNNQYYNNNMKANSMKGQAVTDLFGTSDPYGYSGQQKTILSDNDRTFKTVQNNKSQTSSEGANINKNFSCKGEEAHEIFKKALNVIL